MTKTPGSAKKIKIITNKSNFILIPVLEKLRLADFVNQKNKNDGHTELYFFNTDLIDLIHISVSEVLVFEITLCHKERGEFATVLIRDTPKTIARSKKKKKKKKKRPR